ncbi:tetratricopeptide repeat protein [Colwellia echini]|uniref:Sel1 repeat family protein n=1 Tax=Colwellia echini TaxID=1982103 RepID=A0ABY3MVV7_9GAMM|nr:tetratricopeptide repeat protein [Colwellia echini]TYK65276.1 sel1 repeat family protein [Colwellia echini]
MNTKIVLFTLTLLCTALSSFSVLSQNYSLDQGIYELNRGEFHAAIAQFEPLVAEGYAPAQYQMGLIYQNGYGVSKDGAKAIELFTLAADQNNPDAQFELSLYYSSGKFIKQDLKKAFELTHKAAKKDILSAQFNLAVMYANGLGVEQDDFKASRWYKSAANQNYALAQYNLALLYSEGKGVEKSKDLSFIWNTIAAWNGYPNAETSRKIDARDMSQRMIEENTQKATKLYHKMVAEQENAARLAEAELLY